MKYIRTKDGKIIELKPHRFYKYVLEGEKLYLSGKGKYLYTNNVVDQADTIEELCDEAVFFDKDNKPHYKSQEGNIWYLGAGLFTETLRFCIFTDKGLIYVAKMNEKEELELL